MPRTSERQTDAPAANEYRPDWADLLEQALTMPGELGNTYTRFFPYSFGNQVMLFMQGVREPVATMKRWNDLGRRVLKGSRAKTIIRPIQVYKKDDEGKIESTYTRFKPVRCIFGVSETAGDELPEVSIPSWDYDRALTTLKVREVPFRQLNGNIQGVSVGRTLSINPVAAYPIKTRFHELGHIQLGHTEEGGHDAEWAHQGLREFGAESVGYLCMNALGLTEFFDPSESRAYISGWLQGRTPPQSHIRQVFTATDQILRSGRPPVDQLDLPGDAS